MPVQLKTYALAIVCTYLCSCAAKSTVSSNADHQPTSGDVEIVWQAPTEQVDKFVLYHGANKENLDQAVALDVNTLEYRFDPELGNVYRYTLSDVAAEQSLYVAIASVINGEEQPRSEAYSVEQTNDQNSTANEQN
jgi:hypothetical protein